MAGHNWTLETMWIWKTMCKTRGQIAAAKARRMTRWYAPLITRAFVYCLLLVSCSGTQARPTLTTRAPTRTPQSGEQLIPKTPTTQPTQASSTATESTEFAKPPLAIAARILPYSWSPKAEQLAYWSFTPEEVAIDYTFPPGSLHFLDAKNSATCESSVEIAYPYFTNTLAWSRDGMAWGLASDGQVIGFFPCQAHDKLIPVDVAERILSVSQPPGKLVVVMGGKGFETVRISQMESSILLTGETTDFLYHVESQQSQSLDGRVIAAAISPDEMFFGTTEGVEGAPDAQETRIRDLATGEVRAQVVWDQQPALGLFGPPVWLNADQLLITSNVIGGSLLLISDGRVIEVSQDFFLRNCENMVCETFAAPSDTTPGFHIVVADSDLSAPKTWLMYHSETARVETLPTLDLLSFSPDGLWLSGVVHKEGGQAYELWVRKTDPVGAAASVFPLSLIYVPLGWSPDSSTLAYALTNGVGALNVGSMHTVDWPIGSYVPVSMRWSPDSRSLAAQASNQQFGVAHREALFVLDIP